MSDYYTISFEWLASRVQAHFPEHRMYRSDRSLTFDSPHPVIGSLHVLVGYDAVHVSLLDIEETDMNRVIADQDMKRSNNRMRRIKG